MPQNTKNRALVVRGAVYYRMQIDSDAKAPAAGGQGARGSRQAIRGDLSGAGKRCGSAGVVCRIEVSGSKAVPVQKWGKGGAWLWQED